MTAYLWSKTQSEPGYIGLTFDITSNRTPPSQSNPLVYSDLDLIDAGSLFDEWCMIGEIDGESYTTSSGEIVVTLLGGCYAGTTFTANEIYRTDQYRTNEDEWKMKTI